MVPKHLVHDEAIVAVLGFDDHDLFALRPVRLHPKVLAEPDVGNQLAAHVGDVPAMRVQHVLGGEFDALQAVGQRQHEMRIADPDQ